MGSHSQERPLRRVVAAVLCGLLSVSTVTPYAFAQPKAAPAAAGKKPAKPPATPAGAKPAAAKPAAAKPAGAGKKPAAMSDAQRRAKARKHYEAGVKKLGKDDFAGALTEFQAANELIPSPAANHKIGICQEKLGHPAEAVAAYEKFLAEAPTDKMAEQIADARKRLDAIKTTPMTVKTSSDPAGATIWVDGAQAQATSPTELKLVPGKHKIRMAAPGYDATEVEIEVKAGETPADVALTLASAPVVVAPPVAPIASAKPTPPPAPVAPPAPVQPAKKNNLPAYITLGVAGASAVVGTVFGFKALSNKSDFDDKPTTGKADDTERNALISDMAFGVALTLGVTGTVLLLSGNKTTEAPKAADASHSRMRLSPYVGPSGGGAAASFSF